MILIVSMECSALTITDNKNKEIWESLGYNVELLTDFHPFAEELGAVHCISKYLGRGDKEDAI